MFDAKIYLWHLQAFLISGAKIKKNNYILIEVSLKFRKTIYGT